MAANLELDPTFRNALKLLHSSNPDSAEKIRIALDDIIKQRHGTSKMLINTLSKKHLAEESLSPGSGLIVKKLKHDRNVNSPIKDASNINSTVSTPEDLTINVEAPIIVALSDDDNVMEEDDDDAVVEVDLKELEDLMCIICRRMDVSARNRLVECADCHSLYHQECHKPQISESDANDQENSWHCNVCKGKNATIVKSTATVSSPAKISSHSKSSSIKNYESSSSSSSSSGKHKHSSKNKSEGKHDKETLSDKDREKKDKEHRERDRGRDKEKSKERDRDRERNKDRERDREKERDHDKEKDKSKSSSSSTSSSTVTPSINIISADKRLLNMKKKAAKLQENKRKHK